MSKSAQNRYKNPKERQKQSKCKTQWWANKKANQN